MISRWQRQLTDHPRIADVVAVIVLAGISLPGTLLSVKGATVPPRLPGALLTGVACAALLGYRAWPRVTAVAAVGCVVAVTALGYTETPLLLAPAIVALFLLATRDSRTTAYVLTVIAVIAVVSAALAAGPPSESLTLKVFGPAAWLLLGTALGAAAWLRRTAAEAAHARAEYAERTREEEARHRVAEERIRIARELHDVVAHHLALANAQAGAVAHLIRSDPGQAGKLAAELSGTTSSALRELKAAVGLLRQDGDPEVSLEPPPGLARLPDLIASFRSAGLTVTVTTDREQRPLSPGVDLTAFRIISEALTNVVKHAPGSEARVRLGYGSDLLRIAVANDTGADPPLPGGASGFGLIGMRERAQSVGGRISSGPCPGGGFEVTVELPLETRVLYGNQAR
jgi:signal transduction histidine kinase